MSQPGPDPAGRLAAILTETAREEIVPRFAKLRPDQIRRKSGPLDLVTEADEAAERVISRRLRDAFPGIAIVGEEDCARDPAILETLADAPLAVVVDPVDGTSNFAAGNPLFGSMAALIASNEIVAAAIHFPLTGETLVAERGAGAFLRAEGREPVRLAVAPPVPVEDMAGKAAPRHFPDGAARTLSLNLLHTLAIFDFRCAAHEYRLAVTGACHFLLYSTMMPWDHAPGVLLHREAGGHARRLDGSPYRVTERRGGLLCTPDEASWHALRAALFD